MDAISYSYADKQAKRIKKFINNPDSDSGIVTVPKVIGAGESVTIPAGRVAVLPSVQVDGTLNIDGEVFIPSGSTYTDTAIESNNAVFDTLKVQGQNVSPFSGFKNYIINGNFDIWQRDISQTSSGYGSDDRWSNGSVGSTKTHSRISCTDVERALFNANFFSRTVVTSVDGAGNTVFKQQKIEDVTRLAGKTVTLSFWAKADAAKNIAIDFNQVFGTGGTPSSVVNGLSPTTIPLTTTWQKKTVTLTLPSTVGKTLGTDGPHTSYTYFEFWFDAGSQNNARTNSLGQQSGTFDIAQVQLEEGSVATPFEQRPYGLELSLCQRYYEIIVGERILCSNGNVSSWLGATVTSYWKSTKRVSPTVTLTNWSGTMTAVPTASAFGLNAVVTSPSVQAATNQYGQFGLIGSAEL